MSPGHRAIFRMVRAIGSFLIVVSSNLAAPLNWYVLPAVCAMRPSQLFHVPITPLRSLRFSVAYWWM